MVESVSNINKDRCHDLAMAASSSPYIVRRREKHHNQGWKLGEGLIQFLLGEFKNTILLIVGNGEGEYNPKEKDCFEHI